MPRVRMTRSESQAITRADLIDAAATLFERQGFHRTTLGEIAAEAGYTTGAVYSNFERKEELAMAVLQRDAVSSLEALTDELTGVETIEEQMVAVVRWRRAAVEASAPLGALRLELAMHAQGDQPLREAMELAHMSMRGVLADLLRRQVAAMRGSFTCDAEIVASAMLAVSDGSAIARLVDPTGPDDEAFVWGMAACLSRAIEPSPIADHEWATLVPRVMAAVDAAATR